MTLKPENPRMVFFLFGVVLLLGALLEYDNRVLAENIEAMRYCIQNGVR